MSLAQKGQITVTSQLGRSEVQLLFGDITRLPVEQRVDFLFISAFQDYYIPAPGTVVGALSRTLGLSVKDLASDKALDLRHTFNCWLSKPLPAHLPYARLVCFERMDVLGNLAEQISGLFRAMMPIFNNQSTSVITPLLAVGRHQSSEVNVLEFIVTAACHWIKAGLPLSCLKIVVYASNPHAVNANSTALLRCFSRLKATWEERRCAQVVKVTKLYDICLSFSADDEKTVTAICQSLRKAHSKVVIHRDLVYDHAEVWQHKIFDVMIHSHRIVAVLTPSYVGKSECLEQFNLALCCNRLTGAEVLAPFYLQTVDALPSYMTLIQYTECRVSNEGEKKEEKIFSACQMLTQAMVEEKSSLLSSPSDCGDGTVTEAKSVPSSSTTYDIFISYAHKTPVEANKLYTNLLEIDPDLKVFLDRSELRTGNSWQETLYEAVDKARVVVAFFTPSYVQSTVCQEEYNIALARYLSNDGIFLLPLLVDGSLEEIPALFSAVPLVDMGATDSDASDTRYHSVAAVVVRWLQNPCINRFCHPKSQRASIPFVTSNHRHMDFKTRFIYMADGSLRMRKNRRFQNEARESSSPTLVSEQSSSPAVNEQSSSPAVSEQSSCPAVNEQSSSPAVNEQSSSPAVNEQSSSPEVNEQSSSPAVNEQSSSPEVNEQSSSPLVKEQSSSQEVNEQSSSPAVNEQSSSPAVNEQSSSPEVNEQSSSPLVKEQSSSQEVNEQSSSPAVNEQSSSPSVNEQSSSPSVNEQSSSPAVNEQSSSPEVNEQSSSPEVNEQSSSPLVKEQSSSQEVNEQSSSPAVNEQSSSPSVNEESSSPAVNEQSSSPAVNEQSSSPSVNEQSSSPSVNEQSSSPAVNEQSSSPAVNEQSSSPAVNEQSSSPAVNEQSSSPAVNEQSSSPAVNEQSSSPAVNEQSSSPAVNEQSSSPAVNEQSSSPAVNEQSSSPAVNEQSSSPAVNEQASSPSVNEQSSSPAVNEQSSSPAVNEQSSSPAVNEQSSSPAVNEQSSSPAVNEQSSSPAVNEQSSSPAVNEQSSSPTVNEQSSSPAVNEQSSSPAVNEQSSCPAVNEQSSCPTVNEQSSSPEVNEQSSSPAVNEQSSSPAVNEQSSSPAVNEQSSSPAVNEQSSPSKVNPETVKISPLSSQETTKGQLSSPRTTKERPSSLTNTAEGQSPSPHTAEGQSPSPHTAEGQSPSPHTAEGQSPSPHTAEGQSPSPHTAEGQSPSSHTAEGQSSSPHTAEGQSPSPHTAEGQSPSPHTAEGQSPSPHTAEGPSPSSHTAEGQSSSPHTAEGQSPSPHTAEGQLPSPHTAEGQSPSPHTAEGQSPSPHTAEGQLPSPHTAEGQSLSAHTAEGQVPTSHNKPKEQSPPSLKTVVVSFAEDCLKQAALLSHYLGQGGGGGGAVSVQFLSGRQTRRAQVQAPKLQLLDTADMVVVIVSDDYLDSSQHLHELHIALCRQRTARDRRVAYLIQAHHTKDRPLYPHLLPFSVSLGDELWDRVAGCLPHRDTAVAVALPGTSGTLTVRCTAPEVEALSVAAVDIAHHLRVGNAIGDSGMPTSIVNMVNMIGKVKGPVPVGQCLRNFSDFLESGRTSTQDHQESKSCQKSTVAMSPQSDESSARQTKKSHKASQKLKKNVSFCNQS